jgi:SH3-like domain-containing protein
VTTTAVNLRATPSTGAKVLAVVPEGAIVGDLEESANGFRKVSYKGAIGWCWADYLR